jgi:hypothetical protein
MEYKLEKTLPMPVVSKLIDDRVVLEKHPLG